ncbi:hypothetical protein JB92DRAFT_2831721 [Gautieria morchelliformis]|nr:hypothetical protein JB92DRAFT_2831721 [Gautieria morchelliformis]
MPFPAIIRGPGHFCPRILFVDKSVDQVSVAIPRMPDFNWNFHCYAVSMVGLTFAAVLLSTVLRITGSAPGTYCAKPPRANCFAIQVARTAGAGIDNANATPLPKDPTGGAAPHPPLPILRAHPN